MSKGYIGLFKTIPDQNQGIAFISEAYEDGDLVARNNNGEAVGLVFSRDTDGSELMVIDRIRVRKTLVVSELVYQQNRGVSGNLFVAPVGKIKKIIQ